MRGNDLLVVDDTELVENIAGTLHGLPVAGGSHDHRDFGLYLVALSVLRGVFGRDVLGLPGRIGFAGRSVLDLPKAQAAALQAVAQSLPAAL